MRKLSWCKRRILRRRIESKVRAYDKRVSTQQVILYGVRLHILLCKIIAGEGGYLTEDFDDLVDGWRKVYRDAKYIKQLQEEARDRDSVKPTVN